MATIVRAMRTCSACPSQWDAWDADGMRYYLRYRYGTGTVQEDGPAGPVLAEFYSGDPLDGSIELDEFARQAGLELDL